MESDKSQSTQVALRFSTAQQGTEQWHRDRLGHITSSKIDTVLTKARSGGGLSVGAETYMLNLIGERLTGKPCDEFYSKYTQWGKDNEAQARAIYALDALADNAVVTQIGFVWHPTIRWVGGSPDSLVGADGILEIKCPYTAKNHLAVVLSNEVPDEHMTQCQANLWVTGRAWCDYVSFHPDMPLHLQSKVIRVLRDEIAIEEIDRRVRQFAEQLEIRMAKLLQRQEQKA